MTRFTVRNERKPKPVTLPALPARLPKEQCGKSGSGAMVTAEWREGGSEGLKMDQSE